MQIEEINYATEFKSTEAVLPIVALGGLSGLFGFLTMNLISTRLPVLTARQAAVIEEDETTTHETINPVRQQQAQTASAITEGAGIPDAALAPRTSLAK